MSTQVPTVARISLGNGDGTFKVHSHTSTYTGGDVYNVSTGDFNGDGFIDFAIADDNTDVLIMIGNGNGTFKAGVSYNQIESNVREIQAIDIDKNGATDLLLGMDGATNGLVVVLGNGNGTFKRGTQFAAGDTTATFAAADIDGNGTIDLLTPDQSSTYSLGVLLGNGNGTFKARVSYTSGTSSYLNAIAIADLNGDGRPDVVSSDASGFLTFFGNGNGTFLAPRSFAPGTVDGLVLNDTNGDGKLDIISQSATSFSVLLGNGDGSFLEPTSYATAATGNFLTVGDLNGDSVDDYLSGAALLIANANSASGLAEFDLSTRAGALEAMETFDQALLGIVAERGSIGAVQSRILAGRNTLEVARENFISADSQIADVDVADEAARLVRLTVLQRASAAILSQANQAPALALRLLE